MDRAATLIVPSTPPAAVSGVVEATPPMMAAARIRRMLLQGDGQLCGPGLVAHDQRVGALPPRPGRRFEEERADGDSVTIDDELVVDDRAEGEPEHLHVFDTILLREVRRHIVALNAGVLQQLFDLVHVLADAGLRGEGYLTSLRRAQDDFVTV